MFFLRCDYKEDPKVPPTRFTLKLDNRIVHRVKVKDHPDVADAYNAMIGWIKENVPHGMPILSSSTIDYLFMDGILEECGKDYQTPVIETWEKVS
jgi:hypothetical protein